LLRWELRDERGRVLDHGDRMLDSVPHYGRLWIDPEITIPESLPEEKVKARLYLKLTEDGIPVSANEYELLLTTRDWVKGNTIGDGKLRLAILKGEGADKTAATLTSLGIECTRYPSVTQMLAANPTVAIISDTHVLNDYDAKALCKYEENGGRILFLNSNEAAKAVEAARKRGVDAALYDMIFASPLDEAILKEVALRGMAVVTVEDGIVAGGIGSAIIEWFSDHGYTNPVETVGVNARFVTQGSVPELYSELGMDSAAIESRILVAAERLNSVEK
ncbi:MAG: hypothetical protein K2F62_03045, partial [Muribaculaceae bacterium]|nr:hypothetical protein [Muribaculaceae bacterium]